MALRAHGRSASFSILNGPDDNGDSAPRAANGHAIFRMTAARARKLARLASEPAYWPALRQGVAASVEHTKIPLGSGFRTILDVGSSRGQFALFASTRFPEARIVCFEPLPEPAATLRAVLGGRVELHETAVGAREGSATVHVSSRDDSSSLLPIGRRQTEEFPGTAEAGSVETTLTTLDNALPEAPAGPCLLKVDVQGLELAVLQGAERTLDSVDEALIECSFVELYRGQAMADEVISHMLGRGLRLRGVYETAYSRDGQAIQADLHFAREGRP